MGEQILVAFDESTQSKQALDYALTHFPDASITVLTVVDLGEMNYEYEVEQGEYPVQWLEDAEEDAERVVSVAVEQALGRGINVETAIEFGQPSHEIVSYAEEHDVDSLVLGSHGRENVSRILFGGVAGNVVKRAPVTVTVVR